jgi:glucans biosynthesis protein
MIPSAKFLRILVIASQFLPALAALAAVERVGVDHAHVANLAEKRAAQPYEPPGKDVPKFFREINYDTYRRITFRPETTLWRDAGLRFQLQFFHPGYLYAGVRLNEFTDTHAQPIPFAQKFFDYHDLKIPMFSRWGLDFAGFKVLHPLNQPDKWDELIAFLGASYFRALGRNQVYGASARGLALDSGGPDKEEFPDFVEFWIRKPGPADAALTVHALLDSPSVAGAYTFTITPGLETIVETRATLYFRHEPKGPGFAPLTSMFWFGENSANRFGDYRPEVHDSDGLLVAPDRETRLWRPLQNPTRIVHTEFEAPALVGFGLLQRDRAFGNYADLEGRYERRPGIWTEPIGNWPPGRVRLLELPAQNEYQDNVTVYWSPRDPMPVGKPVELAWKQHWSTAPTFGGPPGWVGATRHQVHDGAPDRTRFLIDFNAASLAGVPAGAKVTAVVTATNGATVRHQVLRSEPENSWRLVVQAQAKPGSAPVELRAHLAVDGRPVTETWTTQWSP